MARKRRYVPGGRSESLRVVLSVGELEDLEEAAEAANLTPTGYLAEAALQVARGEAGEQPGAVERVGVELMTSRTQLRRVGTNLNQAVTRLNATGELPEGWKRLLQRVEEAVTAVDEATTVVSQSVGRAAR